MIVTVDLGWRPSDACVAWLERKTRPGGLFAQPANVEGWESMRCYEHGLINAYGGVTPLGEAVLRAVREEE